MPNLPPPPPWMADLPPLHHPRAKGLDGQQPSLAACAWVEGRAVFSLDVRRLRILALRRRCWCCGYPLDEVGYVLTTGTDVVDRHWKDLHTQGSGPVHKSCATYAACVCPFLKYQRSRRRATGRSQRGTLILRSFGSYAVVFPPDPNVFMTFGHYDAIETVQLTNRAYVADLHAQALTTDAAAGFTETPRLYWTGGGDDLRRLRADWSEAWQKLQCWAQTSVLTVGGHAYRGRNG